MIPQLNSKVLNGSHQHHQKAKKFVFRSQKWRQCLCVSTTARELFTMSLSLRDKLSLEVFIWVFWNAYGIRRVRPLVLSTRQLVSSSRQCTGSPGSCCTRIFSPKTSACSIIRLTALIYPPVIIFCSPNWSYHWKGACLKMFKTSKQLWHRVFGPYHKKTCRGPSSLC